MRKVVEPAVLQVNSLSDMGVIISREPEALTCTRR